MTPALYRFEASDLFNRADYCETDAWFTAVVKHTVVQATGSELVTLEVHASGLQRRDGTVLSGTLYGSPRHEGGSLSNGDGYAISELLEDGSQRSIGIMSVLPLR